MGVIDGQAVNQTVTNAAFLNKNQADTMPFNLTIGKALNFPKNVVSTAGAINALDSTKVNVKLTGSGVTLNGITAGSDGEVMIVQNATGSSVTINSLSGSASTANQINLTTPTVTLANNASIFFAYDSTLQNWIQVGAVGGSANGGSKNYFSINSANQNFVSGSVSPWSACTLTLTSGVPSGAPTLTATQMAIATTGTNPLLGSQSTYNLQLTKSAANAQGQGFISGALTIDREDLAKVLTGSFSYEVVSGTIDLSGSSTQSLEIWIYNTVSGAWTQPTGYRGMNQSSGQGVVSFTFQTDSNATNNTYKIAVITAQTATSAYVVNFNDFKIGPSAIVNGSPITDWTSFTPTGSWTTNTTYSGNWKREGDTLWARGQISLSGAPTNTALIINIPFGLSIDLNKIPSTTGANANFGTVTFSTAPYNEGTVGYQSATSVQLYYSSSTGATSFVGQYTLTSTAPKTWGSGDIITFQFQVPIVGWSSNVQMSSDTDTRVVAASMYSNTTYTTSNNTAFPYTTIDYDTHNALNISNGRFTAPVSGYYDIYASGFARTGVAGNTLSLWKNGVSYGGIFAFYLAGYTISGSCGIQLNAGEYVDFRIDGSVPLSSGYKLSIARRSGPSVIASTETVAMSAYNVSGQTLGASVGATVTGWTKTKDTHGFFNATTGTATIPVSGTYAMYLHMTMYNQTNVVGATFDATINLNGVSIIASTAYQSTVNQLWVPTQASCVKYLNAGDVITPVAFNGSTGSRSLDALDNYRNLFSIVRVGN